MGLFYRTASLLEKGIKPVFVFDGPAPRMKSRVLRKRRGWTDVTNNSDPSNKGEQLNRIRIEPGIGEPFPGI
ncbi:hypothetical protein chiPu_0027918 [Chiloscyllium punctatum]|uniref:XPG N-terminal domain-containing protein n=1 Tax=Chiloscyllium punctatum TaxID=137246 RepID=A0A401TLT3_CHIPU|nr:hypothetical protein [Chiloscyllium punctatum]